MQDIFVIGGNHHNALGVIRALGEKGLRPYVIIQCEEKKPYIRLSKYIQQYWIVNSDAEVLGLLKREGAKREKRSVLIACADGLSSLVDSYHDELSKWYRLPGSEEQGRITRLMDKEVMSQLAHEVGFRVPQSIAVNTKDNSEISVPMPWIIKPLVSKDGKKADIKRIYSEEEWSKYCQEHDSLVQVQQLIEKEFEFQLIGLSLNGGEAVIIPGVSHVIRPQSNTNTGFLRYEPLSNEYAKSVENTKQFLKETGYSGLFSMEFLRGRDGKDYFMEINFRNDGNAICVTAAGVNLPYLWYTHNEIGKKKPWGKKTAEKTVYVMPEFEDIRFVKNGDLSMKEWFKDVRRTDRFMEYDRKDPYPFYSLLCHRSILFLSKIRLIFVMIMNLLTSKGLNNHEKATRRIWSFVALVLVVLVMGVLGWFPSNSLSILSPLNGLIGWFAIFCVAFCIINLFNKERVPGEKEFSNSAFINLLFTLGMGVGIMVYAYNEAAQLSAYSDVRNPIGLTLNHWILIPWCFYVTFAIFEIYDEKYNLLPKWLRLFKTYLYGLLMMLGIGTSFALGVITISGACKHIYGIDIPSYALVVILGSLVTFSLLRGVHRGMKVFAKISMYILYAYIFIMIIVAPSDTMVVGVKAVGSFFGDWFYNNVYTGRAVQNDWTIYYWIWWISWCAFVAPFIKAISKGRTIREIVFYTVVIPSILIAIFMILGNNTGMHLLAEGTPVGELPYVAINVHWIMPLVFVILMSMFYITSSDSQSYAMDQTISYGSKTPVVHRKIMWVMLEVLFVTVLLLAGSNSISALQGLSFLFVPFMILIAFVYVFCIVRHIINNNKKNGLKEDVNIAEMMTKYPRP